MALAPVQATVRGLLKLGLIVGLPVVGSPSVVVAQQQYTTQQSARVALREGDADLMLRLGYMHANVDGPVPYDEAQAAQWFRKAGDLGQTRAMYSLAMCYWSGRGVAQNYVEAYKWLELVAARSVGPEKEWASTARVGIARVMSPAMVEEARKRARAWHPVSEKRKTNQLSR